MKLLRSAVVLAAAASTIAAVRQRQTPVANGQPIGGVSCDAMEGTRLHIHQHLVIMSKRRTVSIPPNVGQVPMAQCLYWVHTHTPDGIIHIEAPQNRTFTLGQFFDIWGQPLTRTQASSAVAPKGTALRIWVNGKLWTADPRLIPLSAHADIVIQAGPPFVTPPKFTNWGGL